MRIPSLRFHEKEMVLPARYASVIRGLANNGGGISGGVIPVHTGVPVSGNGTGHRQSGDGGDSGRRFAHMINDQTWAVMAREMRRGGLIWNMRMSVA